MAIPLKIRASSAVAQGERHAGELPIRNLPRLREATGGREGSLRVQVEAGRDAAGHPQLHLVAQGRMPLTCETCLSEYGVDLELDEVLRLVTSEAEEARLMEEAEPYLVQDDRIPLHELVEDEVLLALPMFPRCDSCENRLQSSPGTASEPQARPNPFDVLKQKF